MLELFCYNYTMHKDHKELEAELRSAAKKVVVGGIYVHFKNPRQTYKVLHIAITERDDKICVIYQAQYNESLIFVRPLSGWLGKVEWQDKTVDRFSKAPEVI